MSVGFAVTTAGEELDQARDAVLATAGGLAKALAAKDADLWGSDATAEAAVRLGWLDVVGTATSFLPDLLALRDALRADGVDRVVLCGMGGSSLAPEVICRTAGVDLTVLDSTHPDQVREALSGDLARSVVVVSSKSGGTLETDSQRRSFIEAFTAAGIDAPSRLVVVTDPGSGLEKTAREGGYRAVFLADPTIGGRYSALSAFGLVPSCLAGADVEALLASAAGLLPQLAEDGNPALVLGAVLAGTDRDKVALDALGGSLVGFGDWAEQLIAESTGKQGKGLLPVVVEPDAPEVQWPAEDVLVVRVDGAVPPVGAATAGDLGAQFLGWEYATAVAGHVLGIDPFDQPDVESAKKAARGLLDSTPEDVVAVFTEGAVEVRATPGLLDGATTLAAAVTALLEGVDPRGYLAVMAYLDRHRDAGLADCRAALARRVERPVTFGWGPRFLHSTGQFHKGGPAIGSFLQVTGLVQTDLPIPDRPFGYATLIAAQAMGDAQVLADHGRPVLRLHLTSSAGLAQVQQALTA